jgi:hypothetical protein
VLTFSSPPSAPAPAAPFQLRPSDPIPPCARLSVRRVRSGEEGSSVCRRAIPVGASTPAI